MAPQQAGLLRLVPPPESQSTGAGVPPPWSPPPLPQEVHLALVFLPATPLPLLNRPLGRHYAEVETSSLSLNAQLWARHSLKVSPDIWETGNVKKISNLPGHVNSSFDVATEFWKAVLRAVVVPSSSENICSFENMVDLTIQPQLPSF